MIEDEISDNEFDKIFNNLAMLTDTLRRKKEILELLENLDYSEISDINNDLIECSELALIKTKIKVLEKEKKKFNKEKTK